MSDHLQKDQKETEPKNVDSPSDTLFYEILNPQKPTAKTSKVEQNENEKDRQSKSPQRRRTDKKPQSDSYRNRERKDKNMVSKDDDFLKDEAYYKTKMCPLYDKNCCKKGSACNYAHGEKQLRGLPNFKKTRLCISFKNGECSKNADQCKYAHGDNELRRLTHNYNPRKESEPQSEYREKRHHRENRDRSRDRRDYRDRSRERHRDRDRERERGQRERDRQKVSYGMPYQGSYISNFNSAYMIPSQVPVGPPPPTSLPVNNPPPSDPYALPMGSNPYGMGSSSAIGGGGSYTPSMYGMGPYDSSYGGYLPHSYPSNFSSSKPPHY